MYRRLLQIIDEIQVGRAYEVQSLVLVLLCREAVAGFQINMNKDYGVVEK